MEDLINRLEKAEAGSRELSDKVLGYLAGRKFGLGTHEGILLLLGCKDESRTNWPCPTTSLDAALALVPEGANWELTSEPSAYINLLNGRFLIEEDVEVFGRAATPALALCIAILKAKAATEKLAKRLAGPEA